MNLGLPEIIQFLLFVAILWLIIYTAVRTALRHRK
ncbi:hypothetical protein B0I32_10888 [Nonomuraea fuscirosea]|uniref:Uncharacterized protein n=1 Tax=Nonomuraea fuscirosea TaxID=1291556 RepID=A0A2T0MZC2_9ACTN|nr:hypothetical protein B0I32_10888 [Nonomuraea fuscirosea]